MIVHPSSRTDSTISHEDDIPPQPLDQTDPYYENGLGLTLSRDQPQTDAPLQSPDTIRPNVQRKDPVAFHQLPKEVLERYVCYFFLASVQNAVC